MRKYLFGAIALATATPAMSAGLMSFLVKEWYANGDHMCQYDNGTVLNVGANLCPLSIGG